MDSSYRSTKRRVVILIPPLSKIDERRTLNQGCLENTGKFFCRIELERRFNRMRLYSLQTAHFSRRVLAMIRGYQGDELWTAMNPSTGKREIVDPEVEFSPGETIIKLIKLYYWKRIWVRDNPWGFAFQSRGGWLYARTGWLRLSQPTSPQAKRTLRLESIQERAGQDGPWRSEGPSN